jgi:2-phosphosulfolactate phosphatase
MNIRILQLIEGARQANGLVVVIDVFRAFSTACYAIERGASGIIPAGSIEEAFRLAEEISGSVLMGEQNERKIPGFDFGNSPTQILEVDLSGKTVIHRSSSGTQGIVNAIHADEIITGSFVNAAAIAQYISYRSPETVSLVCMGYAGERPSQEDTFLAEYIRDLLTGNPTHFAEMVEELREGDGARLLDPANSEWSPASDFDLCLSLDRFDFILRLEEENGIRYLNRIDSGTFELKK